MIQSSSLDLVLKKISTITSSGRVEAVGHSKGRVCSIGNKIQGLAHAMHVLHHLSYLPGSHLFLNF